MLYVSQFAKMLIMDYPCALPCYCLYQYNISLFECGCLVRWGYIIVTVYKGRHCNRKISCSSPFAPTCHVSATHQLASPHTSRNAVVGGNGQGGCNNNKKKYSCKQRCGFLQRLRNQGK